LKSSILLLVGLFSLASNSFTLGQTSQAEGSPASQLGCPIQFAYIMWATPTFRVRVLNGSGKDIQGIKFSVAYYDSVEDLHVIPVDWGMHDLLSSLWQNTPNMGWVIWPTKILYTDGSRWEMSENTVNCHMVKWNDKRKPVPTLPASAITQSPEAARFYHGP
jgi:hypothetical protein